jgi:hypothetical protein
MGVPICRKKKVCPQLWKSYQQLFHKIWLIYRHDTLYIAEMAEFITEQAQNIAVEAEFITDISPRYISLHI